MAEIEIDVTVCNDTHDTHETCLFIIHSLVIIHRRFDDPPQLNEEEQMVIDRRVRDEIHRFMCDRLTDLI